MTLCSKCLEEIISRLTPDDIVLLHSLKDNTSAQTGLTRRELITIHGERMSPHQLDVALNRLHLVGCVAGLKVSRSINHYLTPDGLKVLQQLKNQ